MFFGSRFSFRAGLKVAAVLLCVCFPVFAKAGDDTLTIALDKNLPGKNEYRGCDPFARALYGRLTKAGGEAYYIIYNWKSMDAGWLCHAIVVCRDSKGQYLGMDQNRNMPLLLPGKTPSEWIQWFNGPGEVELVSVTTESKYLGQYADLERKSKGTKKKVVQSEPKVEAKKKPLSAR